MVIVTKLENLIKNLNSEYSLSAFFSQNLFPPLSFSSSVWTAFHSGAAVGEIPS